MDKPYSKLMQDFFHPQYVYCLPFSADLPTLFGLDVSRCLHRLCFALACCVCLGDCFPWFLYLAFGFCILCICSKGWQLPYVDFHSGWCCEHQRWTGHPGTESSANIFAGWFYEVQSKAAFLAGWGALAFLMHILVSFKIPRYTCGEWKM